MAVESRFVVIRNGVEAKTFMDKKSADEYDKMLDMADNLSQVFAQSSIELSDVASEELSIYLAQHREEVLVALLAKKPTKIKLDNSEEQANELTEKTSLEAVAPIKPKKTRVKTKTTKLSEAS